MLQMVALHWDYVATSKGTLIEEDTMTIRIYSNTVIDIADVYRG